MDAAWAQAWLSGAGILISGGFAVLVPYLERRGRRKDENRKRLRVTTTRSEPSGLRVELGYDPEFTHVGLVARVTLLSPEALLRMMDPVVNPAMVGDSHSYLRVSGAAVDGVAHLRLARLDRDGSFEGGLLILPLPENTNGTINKATLRIEVRTDVGQRLLATTFKVSAVDEVRSYWDK
jgi:hypothetical protein